MKTRSSRFVGFLAGSLALGSWACGSTGVSFMATGGSTTGTGGTGTGTGTGGTGTGTGTGGTGNGTGTGGMGTGGAGTGGGPACPDADGDGVTVCAGDCNDGDPTVYPGAPEICGDAKDNNCNGMVDEGCQGIGTYVSTSTGKSTNPGTQALPVLTIAQGIANAKIIGNGVAVYVARGHYSENVTVVEGISLYGGHDPATWVRDPPNNDTAILSQSYTGVYADKSVTRKTILDGFRLQGADNVSMGGRGSAITLDGASPTLTGNVINGPNEGAGVDSHAVLVLAPSNDPKGAKIAKNKITGGTAGNSSYGIAFRSNTFPVPTPGALGEVSRNVVKGGTGSSTFGIACFQCGDGVLIFQNDVTAGTATPASALAGGESSGIAVSGNALVGLITVDSNRINVDQTSVGTCSPSAPTAPWCNGIDSTGAKAVIVNNVVFGVRSTKSTAVWLRNAEGGTLNTIVLNSNYLDGAGSANAPSSISASIVLSLTAGVAGTVGRIRNDILAGGLGATRYGIYEDSLAGKTCTFEKLENNDFFFGQNPTDVLYRTWSGVAGASVNLIASVNALNPGNAAANFTGNPTVDATFHLMAGSPCIDKGSATEAPALDFEGDARPKGAGYDVGPDEH